MNHDPNIDPSRIWQWFDELEASVAVAAKRAGLLEHATSIGNVPEFLIHEVLSAFLPPSVHVGTGIVVGQNGDRSKQMDVIIYDSQFPILRFPGGSGLYLLPGVIATIEIKSQLTGRTLTEAIENCRSFINLADPKTPESSLPRLYPHVYQQGEGDLSADFDPRLNAPENQKRLFPPTYVFSFSSELTAPTVAEHIDLIANGECTDYRFLPAFPRVLLAGNILGILRDGSIHPNAKDFTIPDDTNAMVFFSLPTGEFGLRWLGMDLLAAINFRIGSMHAGMNGPIGFEKYLDLKNYWQSRMSAEECTFVTV